MTSIAEADRRSEATAPEIPAPGPDTLAARLASVLRLAADMAEDLIREDGGTISDENRKRARARLAAAASVYWIGSRRSEEGRAA